MGTSSSKGEHQLIGATESRSSTQVLELLDQGSDLNEKNSDGHTPTHIANYHGWLEIVNLELRTGADGHQRKCFGIATMDDAVKGSHVDTLKAANYDVSSELENADKLKRLANAKFNTGDVNAARLLYTEALGCLPISGDTSGNETVRSVLAALYANRAVTFFREKEFELSCWDCDVAIQLDPNFEKPYIRKARALAAQSRYDGAIDCLRRGLNVLPPSSKLNEELAKLELEASDNGDTVRAVVAMDSSHFCDYDENADGLAEKLKRHGDAYFKKGEFKAARQLYSDAIRCMVSSREEYDPEKPTIKRSLSKVYSNRAVTFFRDKLYAESFADCEKAIELDPKTEKGYTRRDRALTELERMKEKIGSIEARPDSSEITEDEWVLVDKEGEDPSPDAIVQRSERLKKQGNAKFNKGEIQAARELYSKAIACLSIDDGVGVGGGGNSGDSQKSSLSILYSNRSVTFFRDKLYEEALRDCHQAIELDPTAEKAYIRKARTLQGLGRMQEALDCLKMGSKLLPNSQRIRNELNKSDLTGCNTHS